MNGCKCGWIGASKRNAPSPKSPPSAVTRSGATTASLKHYLALSDEMADNAIAKLIAHEDTKAKAAK